MYIDHTIKELLAQRITWICCSDEDDYDGDALRDDPILKIAATETG